MSRCLILSVLVIAWLSSAAQMDAQAKDSLARRLTAIPAELYAADSSLRIVNIFRPEATAVLNLGQSAHADVLDRLTLDVYRPYASFWQGYLGDEKSFREWAGAKLLASDHPIYSRLQPVLDLRLDSVFTTIASWLVNVSGRRPTGVWYIVFGPGWTDMGGFRDGTMLIDFTQMKPDRDAIEFTLAHELTHMLHGASTGQRTDPDSSTVLQRIISEGVASYAAYCYGAGRRTPAQSVNYTDAEWTWALGHERLLIAAARPYLHSRERADVNRVSSRSERMVDSGPAAVAYFLGFRIVQAYVAKHGPGSWTDLIDLPVREAASRSGYGL